MKKENYLLKLLLMFIVIFGLQNKIYAQPPNNGWQYYRDLSINATPSANYQVKVQLTSGQYTNMNSSGNDLRFTVGTSSTLCDYYIETWNTSGTSTIWVEVPTASTNSLRMWYGNSSASAASDGDATFAFFDAFDGSSINTSKWSVYSGTGSSYVSSGRLYLTSGTSDNNGSQVIAKTGFSASSGFIVESISVSESGYLCGSRSSFCGITTLSGTSFCGLDNAGCGSFLAYSNGRNGVVTNALIGALGTINLGSISGNLAIVASNGYTAAINNGSVTTSSSSTMSGTYYPILNSVRFGCHPGYSTTASIGEIRVRSFSNTYNASVSVGSQTTACNSPTVPTFSSSTTGCNTTLSIVSGTLNAASGWQWYSESCGGTSVGSGTSITVSPSVTTNYFARGEGGCTGPCGTITVVVSSTVPTLTSSASGCNTTLSVTSGSLNSATSWQWYSGSCGGTSIGSGTSINVSPSANTSYFARGEGGCASPGACGTIAVNANANVPSFNLAASANNQCPGTQISLSAQQISERVYLIPLSQLINVANDCGQGNGSRYGGSAPGFTWTDAGSGSVTNVKVEFQMGVVCMSGAHTPSLNSLAGSSFTPASFCSCSSPSSSPITVNFASPSGYTVGGTNQFTLSNVNTSTGYAPNSSFSNNYARVTVTYGSTGGLTYEWTPGSITTQTINVSPATTTTYSCKATNSSNCSDTKTITVTVDNKPPGLTLSASANNQCPNTQISLSAQVQQSTDKVYLIPLSQLIDVPYNCGNGSLYGYTAPGFKWTDASTGTVTNVKVEYQMGVVCSGATTPSLNSLAGSSFTPTYFCDCALPSSSPITVNFANPSGYNVGGSNQFTFSTGYYGFAPNSSFSNNYARVTVTYSSSSGSASYEWTPGNATTQTISVSPASTTTYSCKATNSAGCFETKTIAVTVSNGSNCCTTPTITCPSTVSENTSTGVCGANVTFSATAAGNPSITYSPASGSFFAVGTTSVTATSTNSCGTDNCTFNVVVSDIEKPTAICKNITVELDNNGAATIAATDVNNGSNDACGIKSLSIDKTSFSCSNIGANTVTLTVTDNNDNVSECTSTVTVQDNVKPTAVCKNITVELDNNGASTIAASQVDNGSNDACGIKSLSIDKTSFSCSNIGANTVTLTVTDNNDNVSECTSTVTVQDNVKPTAVCKNITVELDNNGASTIAASQVDNGSNDACGIKSISVSPNTFNCSNIGSNTVTLTVTDNNNNVSTCDATVTVVGTIPTVSISQGVQPVFCQGGAVVLSSTSNETVTYAWSNNATSANTNVYSSGTYSLTVTNSYGCTNSASTTVTYSQTDLLSSYTILVTDEAEIEKESVVKTGGVGSTGKKGEIEVKDNSYITASGTFAKAKEVEIKSGSSVTNSYSGTPVSVTLPTFAYNPYCDDKCNSKYHHHCKSDCREKEHQHCKSDCKDSHHKHCGSSKCNGKDDVKVKKGATVTITDSIFRKIHIESDATVTFTSKNIYADEIETQKNVVINFSGCARVFLCKELKIHEGNSINAANNSVIIYAEKKVDIKKGTSMTANIYTLEDLDTKADKKSRNTLTGMFIAEEVHAHFTDFNWNTVCGSCGSLGKKSLVADLDGLRDASVDYVNVYPNPTASITTVTVNANSEGTLKVEIISLAGKTLFSAEKADFKGLAEIPLDLTTYAAGMYFIKVQYADTVKMFKVQRLN